MVVHHLVALDLALELHEHPAQRHDRRTEVRVRHGFDRLDVGLPGVLEPELAVEQSLEILLVVAHDLAHEHVLEAEDRPGVPRCAE